MSGGMLWDGWHKSFTVRHWGKWMGRATTWMEGGLLWVEFCGKDFIRITARRPPQARVLVEWFVSSPGGLWPPHVKKGALMDDLLKKALSAEPPRNGRPREMVASGVFKQFPFLWAFLTCTEIEKGKVRETATLTLAMEQDRLKGCLRDRGAQRVAWGTGDSLEGLLEDLEVRLKDGSIGWRPDRFAGRKK